MNVAVIIINLLQTFQPTKFFVNLSFSLVSLVRLLLHIYQPAHFAQLIETSINLELAQATL